MSDPSTRLREAREKRGFSTAKEAAEVMGVNVATYIQHENGTRNYRVPSAEKYARFYRVSPEWLLYGRKSLSPLVRSPLGPQIPLVGSVAAGVWQEAMRFEPDDHPTFTGRPDIAIPQSERFGLRVEGDSMNLVFPHGTLLECVRYWGDQIIASGSPVIVQRKSVEGRCETTVKEFIIDGDGVEWLVPRSTNPSFQAPIRCDEPGENVEEIAIIARVVASIQRWGD